MSIDTEMQLKIIKTELNFMNNCVNDLMSSNVPAEELREIINDLCRIKAKVTCIWANDHKHKYYVSK